MLNPENIREIPESVLNWAPDAPKGGKAVMNRVLKDGASVPLFFAQTLIASLRDVGYNTTTSAICEHIDNAIQAGATEVRVYFRQTGKQKEAVIDAAVYDSGSGMAPNVLNQADQGLADPVEHGRYDLEGRVHGWSPWQASRRPTAW
jgi:Histidine kinase-, DNA gyrase B-, and HSP90-like ATPase